MQGGAELEASWAETGIRLERSAYDAARVDRRQAAQNSNARIPGEFEPILQTERGAIVRSSRNFNQAEQFMSRSLSGRRVLVTGGSGGIGRAIAELAISRGAQVAINGRDPERLESACRELDCSGFTGDVGVVEDCRTLVEHAVGALGGLDVLINNAAWGHRMTLEDLDPERFEAMWRANVLGSAVMAKESLPHLRASKGDIVNIASTAGLRGYAGGSAYCSTKFSLRGMSQCWQAELRKDDIRVIQINPSEVQTGFGGRDPENANNPKKLVSEDIAHSVIAALEMDARGFIPELTVYATNPWD